MRLSVQAVAIVTLLVALALPMQAERRRTVAPSRGLTIEFSEVANTEGSLMAAGSDAWIDLSSVSPKTAGKPSLVRRRIGIRVLRSEGTSWGAVMITATLQSPDGRAVVRIDGRPLGSTPLVIESGSAVGALTIHTIDIEVPATVIAGPLAASINWQAITQ